MRRQAQYNKTNRTMKKKLGVRHVTASSNVYEAYCDNFIYRAGSQKRVLVDGGYITLSGGTKYHYYLKDHLGNNRMVVRADGTVEQVNHYYPYGGLMGESSGGSVQPYKYNGKELERMNGLDLYDYGARWMDGALGRFTTMDPMCEKYYSVSPYAYCGGNPVNAVDPDGRDWYQNNQTQYYTWFENCNEDIDGFTHIGNKGAVLGEFETIIDHILTDRLKVESLYSDGFTFDVSPVDKGALVGSKERDWDFFDEFVNGSGPEFSVLTAEHPYTREMMSDKGVLTAQRKIREGDTDVRGQITNYNVSWGLFDYLTTYSLAKQFIGSYTYDAFTSSDGNYLYNVISDSKSVRSLCYHMVDEKNNHRRSERKQFGNTYQFYIWKSRK